MNKINHRTDIPGMMFEKELHILSQTANLVKPSGHILEIGACFGRSTHALYLGKDPSVSLTTVDIWGPPISIEPGTYNGNPELLKELMEISKTRNDSKFGFISAVGPECLSNINVVQTSSANFKSNVNYDLVFIDGDHSYDGVKIDISNYVYDDNTLIVGDDFLAVNSGLISAVIEGRRNRILIVPPSYDCKLFFLVPTTGYWFSKIPELISFSL
jgi:hypothetical protein